MSTPELQNGISYETTFGITEREYSSLSLEASGEEGATSLLIRPEGAMILGLSVNGKTILTSPDLGTDFQQPVKIDATHTMLPAGMAEFGPQHGASRYLKYETDHAIHSEAQLSARDGLHELGHTKTFQVLPNGLQIIDDVVKLGEETEGLSLGEHFYFKVDQQQIPEIEMLDSSGVATDITVRRKDGSTQTGTIRDLWPELSEGNSFFYEGFDGSQLLRLPTGDILKIEAHAESPDGAIPVQMLIWHRPGTDTVCFEPLAGRTLDSDGNLKNSSIVLQPHQTMQLTSQVTIV